MRRFMIGGKLRLLNRYFMHENRNPVKSLNTELEVLNILNKIYDDGKEEIAGKIATSIRVICKDTSRCKSLLFQTNLKDQIIFSF